MRYCDWAHNWVMERENTVFTVTFVIMGGFVFMIAFYTQTYECIPETPQMVY